MQKARVLLSGATGYLGRSLLRRLMREAELDVAIMKRSYSDTHDVADLLPHITTYDLDRQNVASIFAEQAPDIVINCATHYGRGEDGLVKAAAANLMFPLELLHAANRTGTSLFIQADTSLPPQVSPYALAKHQFGQWLEDSETSMKRVRLKLEHFYGPGDGDGKFIAFVTRSLVRQTSDLPLTAGEQLRDFIYIDDVVEAITTVLAARENLPEGTQSLQVGSGQGITIRDLVLQIRDLVGNKKTELVFGAVPYRLNEIMHSVADWSRLADLGWRPQVGLLEGLRNTIEHERNLLRRIA